MHSEIYRLRCLGYKLADSGAVVGYDERRVSKRLQMVRRETLGEDGKRVLLHGIRTRMQPGTGEST